MRLNYGYTGNSAVVGSSKCPIPLTTDGMIQKLCVYFNQACHKQIVMTACKAYHACGHKNVKSFHNRLGKKCMCHAVCVCSFVIV